MRRLIPSLAALSCLQTVVAVEVETDPQLDQLAEVLITASRLDDSMAGANTTFIDAETIADAPVSGLPELLAYQSGVQYRALFGNVGGTQSSVDMRGFGAAGSANTLILINGRRLNDIDLSYIDFGNIPLESIQHIEIIRGNAGAVLYGDGAVGGVINIITATGFSPEPSGVVELSAGSDDYYKGNVSYNQDFNNLSVFAFAAITESDGYRDNNELEQQNFLADIRYTGEDYEIYGTLSFDDQNIGLPGGRLYEEGVIDELGDDPKGATTPDDETHTNGYAFTLGSNVNINNTLEFIIDAGVRYKEQDSDFFGAFGDSFVDTELGTYSITPRIKYNTTLGDTIWESTSGVDIIFANYESSRRASEGGDPIHDVSADQLNIALYSQNTFQPNERLSYSIGLRLQQYDFSGEDDFDASVVLFPDPGGKVNDTDKDDIEYALHLGAEYEFLDNQFMFGRIGRSFRLPTIDERFASNALEMPGFTFPSDASFDLDVQTSFDVELGWKTNADDYSLQVAAYWMQLEDELHFDVSTFVNTNLDDTERWGVELQGDWDVAEHWNLFAALSFTHAEFTSGTHEGNDVPLVSPFTATVSARWQALEWLSAMLAVNHVDERRMDNDQGNTQPKIPDYTLVDLRIKAVYEQWRGSLTIQNITDEEYYTTAIASAFTPNRYSAYPLPGTSFIASLAYTY